MYEYEDNAEAGYSDVWYSGHEEVSTDSDIKAATTIQRMVRGHLDRELVMWMHVTRDRAAVQCQKMIRGRIAKRHADKRSNAISVLQRHTKSNVRGWKQRRLAAAEIHRQFCQQKAAAVHIQRAARGRLARRIAARNAHRNASALRIQKTYRGRKARKDMQRRDASAVYVQRAVRGRFGRMQAHKKRLGSRLRHENALRIQCIVRGRQVREAAQRRHRASIDVQRVFRGQSLRQEARKRSQAAEIIQNAMHVGRAQRIRFLKKRAAASTIQRFFRERAHDETAPSICGEDSATRIQAAFRGLRARRLARDASRAARKIQASVRGRQARCDLKNAVSAASHIQRIQRGRAVRQFARRRSHAACTIQSRFKMHRRHARAASQENAAETIQRAFRSTAARQQAVLLRVEREKRVEKRRRQQRRKLKRKSKKTPALSPEELGRLSIKRQLRQKSIRAQVKALKRERRRERVQYLASLDMTPTRHRTKRTSPARRREGPQLTMNSSLFSMAAAEIGKLREMEKRLEKPRVPLIRNRIQDLGSVKARVDHTWSRDPGAGSKLPDETHARRKKRKKKRNKKNKKKSRLLVAETSESALLLLSKEEEEDETCFEGLFRPEGKKHIFELTPPRKEPLIQINAWGGEMVTTMQDECVGSFFPAIERTDDDDGASPPGSNSNSGDHDRLPLCYVTSVPNLPCLA